MTRTWIRAGGLFIVALLMGAPASAQVVQSFQVGVGGFFPRGLDARVAEDVLLRNFVGEPLPAFPTLTDSLAFQIKDFRSGHAFGEWNVAIGPHLEIGAGIGIHGRSVPTLYRDLVDPDQFDIEQTLRLRTVPITALVRFMPFGGFNSVQPYVGVGVSALLFRYSEIGSFVDPVTLDIFDERFVTTGTAFGPLLAGGIRVPLGGDVYALSLEGRYQYGSGKTGGEAKGFVADKIDLGGGQFTVGFLVRF
jgi:hypothetical protein